MPWWLSFILPYVLTAAGTALTGLVVRWLHHLNQLASVNVTQASDQAKLDDLEHLLDTAVSQAIAKAGADVASGNTAVVVQDALAIFKGLVSPQLVGDLESVLNLAGGALWKYVEARITGKAATGLVLSLTPAQASAFHSLPLDQQRAIIAAKGAKMPDVHVTAVAAPAEPRGP